MKLYYREEGSGFPVVILHGLFGMSDNWMTVARDLAKDYKVIVVDLRNHGNSPRSETWNYQAMAEDLSNLVKELSLDRFHLVGHSMGGKVAMEFVQQHPEKVEKLVVVDIAPRAYPVHHQHIIDALYQVDLTTLKSRQDAEKVLEKEIEDWGTRQFLMKNLSRSTHGFEWKFNLDVIAKNIENVGAKTSAEDVDTPTLFVKGSKSEYITSRDTASIKEQFKNAYVVTIKDAGHWVHAEKTSEFLETLRKYLEWEKN